MVAVWLIKAESLNNGWAMKRQSVCKNQSNGTNCPIKEICCLETLLKRDKPTWWVDRLSERTICLISLFSSALSVRKTSKKWKNYLHKIDWSVFGLETHDHRLIGLWRKFLPYTKILIYWTQIFFTAKLLYLNVKNFMNYVFFQHQIWCSIELIENLTRCNYSVSKLDTLLNFHFRVGHIVKFLSHNLKRCKFSNSKSCILKEARNLQKICRF